MLKFKHPRLLSVWIAAPLLLAALVPTTGAAARSAEPSDSVLVKSVDCRPDASGANVDQQKKSEPVHVGATGYGAPPP